MASERHKALLDRLAQLHDDDLTAVVQVVESALIVGDAWLQRTEDGKLRKRSTFDATITEHGGDDGGAK